MKLSDMRFPQDPGVERLADVAPGAPAPQGNILVPPDYAARLAAAAAIAGLAPQDLLASILDAALPPPAGSMPSSLTAVRFP